ncbi:hypothetical protein KM043_004252 [Ampulex compressa]|nr:hypothetical protein KM043_004252 [Ampulex compressa]
MLRERTSPRSLAIRRPPPIGRRAAERRGFDDSPAGSPPLPPRFAEQSRAAREASSRTGGSIEGDEIEGERRTPSRAEAARRDPRDFVPPSTLSAL